MRFEFKYLVEFKDKFKMALGNESGEKADLIRKNPEVEDLVSLFP